MSFAHHTSTTSITIFAYVAQFGTMARRQYIVPVVQWIERRPPKLEIEVRLLAGTLRNRMWSVECRV